MKVVICLKKRKGCTERSPASWIRLTKKERKYEMAKYRLSDSPPNYCPKEKKKKENDLLE